MTVSFEELNKKNCVVKSREEDVSEAEKRLNEAQRDLSASQDEAKKLLGITWFSIPHIKLSPALPKKFPTFLAICGITIVATVFLAVFPIISVVMMVFACILLGRKLYKTVW